MKKFFGIIAALMVALPGIAYAQELGNIQNIVNGFANLVASIVPILLIIATIVFFWGLIRFIMSAGDEDGRKAGIQTMIYGVIALAVMVSVWGLVGFLQSALGIENQANTISGPTGGEIKLLTPGDA